MINLNPSDDDSNLVNFVRKNQPNPPLKSKDVEQELMTLVKKYPRAPQASQKRWSSILPGLIAIGILSLWGSYRWSLNNSQASIDEDAIETFLVDNWQDTLTDNNIITSRQPEENYLLLPTLEQYQFLSVSP